MPVTENPEPPPQRDGRLRTFCGSKTLSRFGHGCSATAQRTTSHVSSPATHPHTNRTDAKSTGPANRTCKRTEATVVFGPLPIHDFRHSPTPANGKCNPFHGVQLTRQRTKNGIKLPTHPPTQPPTPPPPHARTCLHLHVGNKSSLRCPKPWPQTLSSTLRPINPIPLTEELVRCSVATAGNDHRLGAQARGVHKSVQKGLWKVSERSLEGQGAVG